MKKVATAIGWIGVMALYMALGVGMVIAIAAS